MIGETISHYKILEKLGEGGMGVVYKAQDTKLDRTVALKFFPPHLSINKEEKKRFIHEAKAAAALDHQNICAVHEIGETEDGQMFIAMAFYEGETLKDKIEKGPLNINEAIDIAIQITEGLDKAHKKNITHRDIKSANIIITEEGVVKIVDFGLAKLKGHTKLTKEGTTMGTVAYMSPEQILGEEVDQITDIWSFGVVLYEMITGQLPFKGEYEQTVLYSVLNKEPIPLTSLRKDIPKKLESIVSKSLEKDLSNRYQNIKEIQEELKNTTTSTLAESTSQAELDSVNNNKVTSKLHESFNKNLYRILSGQKVPKRIKKALILNLIFVLCFWLLKDFPLFQNFENLLVDFRFQLTPTITPDNRILLISFDETTMQLDPTLLVEKADEMGALLQNVMDAGAKGIAIDFILPERWNQSESFVKFILKNQGNLILASYIKKDSTLIGPELISGLIMAAIGSPEQVEALFGFINIKPDSDGRIRSANIGLQKQNGEWIYSMSAKLFQILTGNDLSSKQVQKPQWINYSVNWRKFQKVYWRDLPLFLKQKPGLFKSKIVLVGGEYEGSQDFHKIPHRLGLDFDEASGLTINALILNTLLQNKPIRVLKELSVLIFLTLISLFFFTVFLFLYRAFTFPIIIITVILSVGYVLGVYLLFLWKRILLPVVVPLIILILSLVLILWVYDKLTFISKPSLEVKKNEK